MSSRPRTAILGVIWFIVLTGLANAQFRSAIEGTVADSSRAVVTGADVQIVNEQTDFTIRARTNDAGFFRVTELPPGSYRVTVQREGFKSWAQPGLILEGDTVRSVYPVLAVGEQKAVVEVAASIATVETGTSKVSRALESKTLEDAPMIGRNVYGAVVSLAPGITGSGGLFGSGSAVGGLNSFQTEPGYQINAAGQRQEANEYQVDGASVNGKSRDGIANLTPEPDTVQEIRVAANSYSAEKGRYSGALIEVFTKSGTNQFHGTLSEFHTDSALLARTIFQQSILASRRNEFGFTLGGPVVKNKTFLFGGVFWQKASTASTSVVTEETPEFRDYVARTYPNSLANHFFSVAHPVAYPSSAFRTVAQVRQSNPGFYPSTQFPDNLLAVGTALINETLNQPGKQINLRIDHNIRDYRDRFYGSWFRNDGLPDNANARTIYIVKTPGISHAAKLDWTHMFAPGLLNEAWMSFTRTEGGNPGTANNKNLPNVSINGVSAGFSQGGPLSWAHNNFSWHDALSWMRGNHQIRVGFDLDRQRGAQNQERTNIRPSFSFANILDFAQDLPSTQSGPAINVASGAIGRGLYRLANELYTGLFAQDDWKVSPRLTVNVGLRWDYFGHWATGKNGKIPFTLFTPGSGATFSEQITNGAMQVRGDGYIVSNRPSGFAPRIGFAWDVFGNGSTSIRAGYGIYYSRIGDLSFISPNLANPPAFAIPSLTVQQGATFSYALGNADGSTFPLAPGVQFRVNPNGSLVGLRSNVGGVQPEIDQPRTQNFSLSIQRKIGNNYVVEADYLGSRSDYLYTQTNVNRFTGDLVRNNGTLTRLNSSFNSITYARSIGISNSNYATLMFGRRFIAGWSMHAMYTFGKALDYDSSNDNGVGGGQNVFDPQNLPLQHGRADYNISRRFALDQVWELPSPWKSGWQSKLAAGWRVATIAILQSGQPFTVFTSAQYPTGDYNADGTNYDAPNTPTFGNYLATSRGDYIRGLFTAPQFPVPARGVEGSLGRNTFDGPGLATVNLSIIKGTRVKWFLAEGANLEIRGEIFNLFNRVNLSLPVADMSNGLFGKSTGQSQPRQAQFGIRIAF